MMFNIDCENLVILFYQNVSLLLNNYLERVETFIHSFIIFSFLLFVQHTFIEFLLWGIRDPCHNQCYVSK